MDLSAVLSPLMNEAVRDFGPFAIVPVAIGLLIYEVRRKLMAKDEEIAALRNQVHELHEKRLGDAREMIRIAESSAAATASRTQSDQRFADLIEAVLRRNGGGMRGWRK